MASSSCHFSPTSCAQIPQYACQPLTPHRGQSVVPDLFLSDTNTLLSLPTDQGLSLPALETPEAAQLPGSDQVPFLVSSSPQNSNYAHNNNNNNTSAQAQCTTDAPESREFEEIDLDPYPLLVTSPDLASLNDLLLNEDSFMTDRPDLSSPRDGHEQPVTQNETPLPSQSDSSDMPEDLFEIGYRDTNGEWRCNFEGCLSTRVFKRACDLRKHWCRHRKDFKCSYKGCSMGFATAKDMRRHQASHNPGIQCTAAGCDRTFSRADNMMDHYRRVHHKSNTNTVGLSYRRRRKASRGSIY